MVELCRKIEYFLVCGKAVAEYEKEETPMKGIVKKAGFTLIVILLLDVLVFPVAAKEPRARGFSILTLGRPPVQLQVLAVPIFLTVQPWACKIVGKKGLFF